jgi:hypothetical protein
MIWQTEGYARWQPSSAQRGNVSAPDIALAETNATHCILTHPVLHQFGDHARVGQCRSVAQAIRLVCSDLA